MSTLGPGEMSPFPAPAIRKVGFSEDAAQFTVAHLLIHSWSILRPNPECNNPPCGDISAFGRELNGLTQEEREQFPQDSDLKTCHTPWRDQIYYTWNHVFYDVGNWLSHVYGTGTFQPPNTEVFTIEFPNHENGDGSKVPAATKLWDADMLFTAAYLAPGISLRVETLRVGENESEPFHSADIEHEDRFNVLCLQKGIQVQIYVEGERDQSVDGLAAVVIYGSVLGEPHKAEESEEESEGEEEEVADGEKGDK